MITDKGKIIANRGVKRNKKPLQNIYYKIEILTPKDPTNPVPNYEQYKFKDLGYLRLYWQYEKNKNKNEPVYLHGFITPEYLKSRLTPNQWSKFCQGEREFVIQRRIDGNNI